MKRLLIILMMTLNSPTLLADNNRIDLIRPDAPELAALGDHDVGVRTLTLTNPQQPDILNTPRDGDTVYADRTLTVEVWYPAALGEQQTPGTHYQTTTRNPAITATLTGMAVRDAAPARHDTAYPLVIISHGYPGNRYLMSHLGENLASKGYVVAAIDHTDSTYEDQKAFASTLYHRAPDQRFVLEQMASFSSQSDHFLSGLVDAENTGLIGYSMGGYGVVNNLGAGYSEQGVNFFGGPPNGLLSDHAAANPDFKTHLDPRIKAGIPIGPWGMNMSFWDSTGLAGLTIPSLFVAGSVDTTSGYEEGIKKIYDGATNSDRYLLTFINAGHSAAAPIPLPVEFHSQENQEGAGHYTDPVWDTLRMNNILQHFVTAFLGRHLKGDEAMEPYLDIPAGDSNGQQWPGFEDGSAIGLRWQRR